MSKPLISFNQYLEIEKSLEISIGIIVEAERVPKSSKLLKLTVLFKLGEDADNHKRIVVTNLGDKFEPEDLLGTKAPFILNLEPVIMMGIKSEAMIVAGVRDNGMLEFEDYSIGTKLI